MLSGRCRDCRDCRSCNGLRATRFVLRARESCFMLRPAKPTVPFLKLFRTVFFRIRAKKEEKVFTKNSRYKWHTKSRKRYKLNYFLKNVFTKEIYLRKIKPRESIYYARHRRIQEMPLTVYAANGKFLNISSQYGSERELISERENVLVKLFHIVFCSFNQIDLVFNQVNRGREWLAWHTIAPEMYALTYN